MRAGTWCRAVVSLAWLVAGCGAPPGVADVPPTYDDDTPPNYVIDVSFARDVQDVPPTCPMGSARCDNQRVCRDFSSDAAHCGSCGHACLSFQSCVAGVCGQFRCDPGLLSCGSPRSCIDPATDRRNCGECNSECGPTQVCRAGACVSVCASGEVWCEGEARCATVASDPTACGACGRRCAASEECVGGVCWPPCAPNERRCGGLRGTDCIDVQSNLSSCGACGVTCAGDHVASARCDRGVCGFTCAAGYTLCASRCVAIDGDDRANCGACGRACVAGERCAVGACVDTGVRSISPLSATRIASWRPRFRWESSSRRGPVVVEVCSSRDCHAIEGSQRATEGDEVRWPTPLAPGVHWWRVRREVDGATSATWEFFIGERDSRVPLVGDPVSDFNGDGVVDAVDAVGCYPRSCFSVTYGSGAGATPAVPTLVRSIASASDVVGSELYQISLTFGAESGIGDFNGDGFADLAASFEYLLRIGLPRDYRKEIALFPGAAAGVRSIEDFTPAQEHTIISRYVYPPRFRSAGDVDGDGYGDVLVEEAGALPAVHFGGTDEVAAVLALEVPTDSLLALADFNGDGIADIVALQYASEVKLRMGARGLRSPDTVSLGCGTISVADLSLHRLHLEGATDLDGDGYPDLAVAEEPGTGRRRYVWSGGPAGLSSERCVATALAP